MKLAWLLFLILLGSVCRAQPLRPPKGFAVLVGVKATKAISFKGNAFDASATLGAGQDVVNMAQQLRASQFLDADIISLTTTVNTRRDSILAALQRVKKLAINPADLVVFYFSGHGDQRPDDPFDRDEADSLDELLVAADAPIVDDELQKIWITFGTKVRLVMIADACHSGTMFSFTGRSANAFLDFPIRPFLPFDDSKTDPPSVPTRENQRTERERTDQRMRSNKAAATARFRAERTFAETAKQGSCMATGRSPEQSFQMIYLGACYDKNMAQGGSVSSLFTTALINLFLPVPPRFGQIFGYENWVSFSQNCQSIVQYAELGPVSDAFRNSRPFQIKIP